MTVRLHTVKNLSESVRVMVQTALVRLLPKVFKINIAPDGRNNVLKLCRNSKETCATLAQQKDVPKNLSAANLASVAVPHKACGGAQNAF